MAKTLLRAAGLVLALIGTPVALSAAPLSNDELLANAVTVLFGSEFVQEDRLVVRRWSGKLRLAIYGDDDGRYTGAVDSHLAHLHRLTGLDIARVPQSDPAQNAYLLLLGPSQFRAYAAEHLPPAKNPNLVSSLACFGLFSVNPRDEITSVYAVIPNALSTSEIEACVIEELTQVLGLPNDSFEIRPSIFNDDEEFQRLTWQDEIFVRLLYDRRVRPGMSQAQFEAVARGILEEWRPGQ